MRSGGGVIAAGLTLPRLGGGTIALDEFAGRPLLVVNTASNCGFTGQYAGLQRLWETYGGRGLTVLGVPSNDFAGQEPGDEAGIGTFCRKNYGVTFPMSGKLHVRGGEAHPLFRRLGEAGGLLARPRWNFYKYLLGSDGGLSAWFSSLTGPLAGRLTSAVESALR